MKVLITGGSGFLGSHIADAYSDAGHEVTIFDLNESQYLRSDQRMVIGDILDQKAIEEAVKGQDFVFHTAALADIDICDNYPLRTMQVNVLGTTYLLEEAVRQNIKRFVFSSSVYVFSDSGSFYATSKFACEHLLQNYQAKYGLPYTILRYGSLYGPRADANNSIQKILKSALQSGKIVYNGTGDEEREFIHVFDAAQSSLKILEEKFENKSLIITGVEKLKYSVLLDMVKEIMNNDVDIEIVESNRPAHYKITPYNFVPRSGRKMIPELQIDLGQGLLMLLADLHSEPSQGQ